MAAVLPSLNSLNAFPRTHARPAVRPRIVPECISVLSEDESSDDAVECALPTARRDGDKTLRQKRHC